MLARAAPSIASPTAEFACPSFKARTVHRKKKGYFAALIAKLLTLPNDTRAGLNASACARSQHQAVRT